MVLVSIIFVNYKSKKDDIKECISSIYKQTLKNFEIIFVDNNSMDGSVEFVRKKFPKVKIIENTNTGFSAGNNLGVRHSNGKYIFILNLDTELDRNCLKEMVECAKRNRGSAITSKILLFEKKGMINATGAAFNYLGFAWCDNLKKREENFSEDMEVTFPSGAAFLIEKKLYNEIGGFDESYFLYCEDSDLGWRLRLKGHSTVLAARARVYHKFFFGRHPKKFYYAERNRIVTILKNYQLKTLLLIFPPLIFTEIGVLFYLLMTSSLSSKLTGYWWILRNFGNIIEKRKILQKSRSIPDSRIVENFKDRIDFEYVLGFKYVSSPLIDKILNPLLSAYWKVIRRFV